MAATVLIILATTLINLLFLIVGLKLSLNPKTREEELTDELLSDVTSKDRTPKPTMVVPRPTAKELSITEEDEAETEEFDRVLPGLKK